MIDSYSTYWHEYYWMLYYFVLSKVRNPTKAEDVASETFARAWSHRDSLRDPAKFKPWLFQIAMNVIRLGARRKEFDSLDDDNFSWERLASAEALEKAVEQKLEAQIVMKKVHGLPAKMGAVINLTANEIPAAEIARQLCLPTSTVRTRLFHARKRLQEVRV